MGAGAGAGAGGGRAGGRAGACACACACVFLGGGCQQHTWKTLDVWQLGQMMNPDVWHLRQMTNPGCVAVAADDGADDTPWMCGCWGR
jgi:hypothetical protein